jgi:hypothetical protein
MAYGLEIGGADHAGSAITAKPVVDSWHKAAGRNALDILTT